MSKFNLELDLDDPRDMQLLELVMKFRRGELDVVEPVQEYRKMNPHERAKYAANARWAKSKKRAYEIPGTSQPAPRTMVNPTRNAPTIDQMWEDLASEGPMYDGRRLMAAQSNSMDWNEYQNEMRRKAGFYDE